MTETLDRLSLLQSFIRIVERGSISAAGRDLGLSQASVSRHLAELERRLGVQLVQRTTHSLSLTRAGEDCVARSRALLGGWDTLVDQYADDARSVRGPLKVVAPVALGQCHLTDAVLALQRDHPGITVTWMLHDALVRFAEIGCDLWIRVGAVGDDTLVVRPLGQVERLVVGTPDLAGRHPLGSPRDLAGLPCAALTPFDGGRIRLSTAGGHQTTLSADVAFATDTIFAAHAAARQGIGYAVLPRWLVAADLEAGRLADLLPDWRAPSLTVNAAYRPARPQPRRLVLLIDRIADTLAAVPGLSPGVSR